LLQAARKKRAGLLSAKFWSDQLMNWAMRDPAFKVQLFRFVDVFPMLTTPRMVHDYLVDYLGQPGVTLPSGMGLGLKAGGLAKGLMSKTIAGRIQAREYVPVGEMIPGMARHRPDPACENPGEGRRADPPPPR